MDKKQEFSEEAIDHARRMIALKWTKETNVERIAGTWDAGYLFGQLDQKKEWQEKEGEGRWPTKVTNEELLQVFKKVSLLDLSGCEFEFGDGHDEDSNGWKTIEDGIWINAIIGGRVIDAIKWDGNIFWMMNNGGDFSPLNPMSEAFSVLGQAPVIEDNRHDTKTKNP